MSLADRFRGGIEQLASLPDDEEPALRGEHREAEQGSTGDSSLVSFLLGHTVGSPSDEAINTERRSPPEKIDEYWTEYYKEFALTRASLSDFSSSVVEPGHKIHVEDANGERDEEMEEALELWAANCVIHAGELGHDLRTLLEQIPKERRGKGTQLVEKVGTDDDPDKLVALLTLDPSTFKIHTRKRQPILVQPDDDVDSNHPRTPTGEAAAYTQYHEDVPGHEDKDPIHFSVDDLIKFTWDIDDGAVWGTSLYDAIADRIDAILLADEYAIAIRYGSSSSRDLGQFDLWFGFRNFDGEGAFGAGEATDVKRATTSPIATVALTHEPMSPTTLVTDGFGAGVFDGTGTFD
jgi:hypothetical protein